MRKLIHITSLALLLALLITPIGSGPTSAIAAGPLVAQWSLNNNLVDSSANGYHLTLATSAGYPQYSADVPTGGGTGSMQYAGGTTGYMQTTLGSELSGNHTFTASFWIKYIPSTKRQWVLLMGQLNPIWNNNTAVHWLIDFDGTANFGLYNGAQNSFDMTPYANQWAHVITIYNSSAGRFTTYVNGTLMDTATGATPNLPATVEVEIGRLKYAYPEDYFKGYIDEIKIYDCVQQTTVYNINDSGADSLRQAIADVCSGGTVTFDSSLSGATIYLLSTLDINKNLTLDGSSLASKITVDGDNTYRIFQVNAGSTVTMKNLILAHGYGGTSGGGAISNAGSLTITNSSFQNNYSLGSPSMGGAIFNNQGTVNISNSVFTSNSSNFGGGIYDYQGTVTISDTTLSSNSASSGGGAIASNGGTVTIKSSTINNNTANNDGGGIDAFGTLTVSNSTFFNNTSSSLKGGGITLNGGTLTLINNTFSNNQAPTGGAIYNAGTLNSTNNILANSTGGDCVNAGTINTNIKNLVEDGSCSPFLSGDPKLDALGYHTGSTQNFSLLAGSPAFDAADDGACAAAPINNKDQRGVTRPIGTHCDIGAHEGSLTPVTVSADNKTAVYASTPAYTFTDSPNITFSTDPTCTAGAGPLNVGTHTITCSGGVAGGYSFSYTSGTLTVTKATPTVALAVSNSPLAFTGKPRAAEIDITSSSTAGSVTNIRYNGSSTQPTHAGTYTVTADFTPTDSTNYNSATNISAGTLKIGLNLVINGGFNSYLASAPKIPGSWVQKGFSPLSGKDTQIQKEGQASLMIVGSDNTQSLIQNRSTSGSSGTELDLSYWVKGSQTPKDGLCQVVIKIFNGSSIKQTRVLPCEKSGTFAFIKRSASITTGSAYSKIVISIITSKKTGTLWFDKISLIRY